MKDTYLSRLTRFFAHSILREDAAVHFAIPRRDAHRHHQTRDYHSARDDHPACVIRKDICCPLPATPLGERDAPPFSFPSFSPPLSRFLAHALFFSLSYKGSLRLHHARVMCRLARKISPGANVDETCHLSKVQRYHRTIRFSIFFKCNKLNSNYEVFWKCIILILETLTRQCVR